MSLIEWILILAIVAILAAIPITGSINCHSRWENSGMESKWAFFSGCRVHMPDSRWIPETNIRDIDIRKADK